MLKVYVQFSRYDKDQSLKSISRKKLSRSFVKQFLQVLFCSWRQGTDYYYITDSLSVSRALNNNRGWALMASSPGGVSAYGAYSTTVNASNVATKLGIVVGTGVGTVALSDSYLGTGILNGTGSGELEYLSCAVSDYTESDPNASFILERFFRNSSGDTITINEVGVCASYYTIYTFLIIRDLVSPAETVADGEYLKITYTFQIEA